MPQKSETLRRIRQRLEALAVNDVLAYEGHHHVVKEKDGLNLRIVRQSLASIQSAPTQWVKIGTHDLYPVTKYDRVTSLCRPARSGKPQMFRRALPRTASINGKMGAPGQARA